MQPAPSLIAATIEELRRHAPFDVMDIAAMQYLSGRLSLTYFAKGEILLAPESGIATCMFIIQKGQVSGAAAHADGRIDNSTSLTEGECFPIGALISRRASVFRYVAAEDTFCYRLKAADFEHVMDVSRPFREFATRRLASLLDQSRRIVQGHYSARETESQNLTSPLKSIIRREPVTVTPETPIRAVLELMKSLRIGSVVVVTADVNAKPLGIFTERDVLDRIALAGTAQNAPITQAMTPAPFSLPAHAALFEAAQAMARFRFRHVLVMEEGKLIGVVSERDLFTLQRHTVGEIAKSIERADSVDALALASGEVRRLASALLGQGVAADQLTQLVTTLNDAVVASSLALAATLNKPPDTPWCWIGLGSEGRKEQTLATDQDNALIFVPIEGEPVDVTRAAFLSFADSTNRILDQCGFPLCKGDIMARNPKWCLSEAEWRRTFMDWMATPHPDALMNAAIFFDFRPLHGELTLAESLRSWLNLETGSHKTFLLLLAQSAVQIRPPLGILRDFVVDDSDLPGTIDLKKYCARPFVDAARVYALKHAVAASNTADRIRLAAPRMGLQAEEAATIIDSFHFIQLLRLRNQEYLPRDEQVSPQPPPSLAKANHPNRIDPDELNALDRRILKEALRQARKFQTRLEMDFQL